VKTLAGFSALLMLATGVFAQTTRNFGSVVFPGGTSATTSGVTRNFGSVVFPGSASVPTVRTAPTPPVGIIHPKVFGNGFRSVVPVTGQNFRRIAAGNRSVRSNTSNTSGTFVYAYPVFVGGYENSMVGGDPPPPPMAPMAPPMVQPPMTTMYSPDSTRPVMIQVAPDNYSRPPVGTYQPAAPEAADEPVAGAERYLLAFKDHTVYSAVAYWFDGDTLHYFTTGNTHNQASVSLLDSDLTTRLNKELGIDFHLPATK
jgi:hypothetical protein